MEKSETQMLFLFLRSPVNGLGHCECRRSRMRLASADDNGDEDNDVDNNENAEKWPML